MITRMITRVSLHVLHPHTSPGTDSFLWWWWDLSDGSQPHLKSRMACLRVKSQTWLYEKRPLTKRALQLAPRGNVGALS